MMEINGVAIYKGIGYGTVYSYKPNSASIKAATNVNSEKEALSKAIREISARAAACDNMAEREFLELQALMLEDQDLLDFAAEKIENGASAHGAILAAGEHFAKILSESGDDYMVARSADVLDAVRAAGEILSGQERGGEVPQGVIIYTDDPSPRDIMLFASRDCKGIIAARGNKNNHASILMRSFGIPSVIQAGEHDIDGKFAIVDGVSSSVLIDPSDDQIRSAQSGCDFYGADDESQGEREVHTVDGRYVKLYANIASSGEAQAAYRMRAQGIGLFRSEFIFISADKEPSEQEQFEAYRSAIEQMHGLPVIIRTMDIGADKQIDYFSIPSEENPALGLRGIRFCLEREECFRRQLRAILRASAFGKCAVMFPMIANLWEIDEAKACLERAKSELRCEGVQFDDTVDIGVMVETPACAIIADEVAKKVDFLSIGTNDLTQYTLAIDRQSELGESRYLDICHPALIKLIKAVASGAHAHGKWVGVCGELAADTRYTKLLLECGVDELSVSPPALQSIRAAISEICLD